MMSPIDKLSTRKSVFSYKLLFVTDQPKTPNNVPATQKRKPGVHYGHYMSYDNACIHACLNRARKKSSSCPEQVDSRWTSYFSFVYVLASWQVVPTKKSKLRLAQGKKTLTAANICLKILSEEKAVLFKSCWMHSCRAASLTFSYFFCKKKILTLVGMLCFFLTWVYVFQTN